MHAPSSTALLWFLAASYSAQHKLWVVDDGGGAGVDFTTIQGALDASSNGDVVLVRPGSYASFTLDGKGVGVAGENAALCSVQGGQAIVRNLPAGSSALIQNLSVRGGPAAPFAPVGPALAVENCAGMVQLEQCSFLPDASGSGGGACVSGSAGVVFTRCVLSGGLPYYLTFLPSQSLPGLALASSQVALWDCALSGGPGTSICGVFGSCGSAQPAGDGIRIESGFVYASGCSFHGGAGGSSPNCGPTAMGGEGAAGGDGARLMSALSELRVLDCVFTAGTAGIGCGPTSMAGVPVQVGAGIFAILTGQARSMSATSPAQEGGTLVLSFQGQPFDLVVLGVAPAPAFLYLEPFAGTLLLEPGSLQVLVLGLADAAGGLVRTLTTAVFPGGDEVAMHYAQAGWLATSGQALIGSHASVVLYE